MMKPQLSKRGAELSLTVIIVAIILIIVLVVVVIIFGGKLNVFGRTTVDCGAQGGYCDQTSQFENIQGKRVPVCDVSGATTIRNTNCPEGQACCINIFGEPK